MLLVKKYKMIFFSLMLVLTFFAFANVCLAVNLQDAFDTTKADAPLSSAAGEGGAGFNLSVDDATIIAFIISLVLQLVGVIFLVLALYGGYTWMMARGNEEMVEKAKNTLTNAIIGLVIVMAAYAISYFVLSQISAKALKSGAADSIQTEQISL